MKRNLRQQSLYGKLGAIVVNANNEAKACQLQYNKVVKQSEAGSGSRATCNDRGLPANA